MGKDMESGALEKTGITTGDDYPRSGRIIGYRNSILRFDDG